MCIVLLLVLTVWVAERMWSELPISSYQKVILGYKNKFLFLLFGLLRFNL
ncbi:Uncharacterized protein APZ42_016832 [Daphnia magna]|uniref:Uncharacterized protein n=1 Tax=Daphnia magna TaxID=35525 RepID=A0A165A6N5_9CRUS|nr:Uncharacterized protein APZ42_016832 [Daphnia magna]